MFTAILITGGTGEVGGYFSSEVFLPSTSTSCLMSTELEVERWYHTLDGLLLCGGVWGDAETSCEKFSLTTGKWAFTNHTLQEERGRHMSWEVEEGTILMGGSSRDPATSEIVKHDGTTERSFDMKYNKIQYETEQFYFISIFHLCITGKLALSRTHPLPP